MLQLILLWSALLQMVVVSEPRLVSDLLHNGNLAKPTQPVMIHFRQVCMPVCTAFGCGIYTKAHNMYMIPSSAADEPF